MGVELTVRELYSNLRKTSRAKEVHIISVTSNKINHYITKEDKCQKSDDLSNIDDVLFVDTTNRMTHQEKIHYTSLRKYMREHNFREKDGDGEVVFVYSKQSNLPQLFVMHNHVLGPGIGGLREYDYKKEYGNFHNDSMLIDCLRLAEGMTYKGAINETNSGGGKSARSNIKPKKEQLENEEFSKKYNKKRNDANWELAIALNIINKKRISRNVHPYYTAEDVGTKCSDFDEMFQTTKYAICKSLTLGGTGNPSPYTAIGTIYSMIEGAKRVFRIEENPLKDRIILLEGIGNCGREVMKHLVNQNARVIATDITRSSIKRAKLELGDLSRNVDFKFYNEDERKENPFIFLTENRGEIYSPCALGATVNKQTRRTLKDNGIKLISGSANNQLENSEDSEILHYMNILYLPDYVVNGAGLINARQELPDILHRMDNVVDLARGRGNVISRILDLSYEENITPLEAVTRIVNNKLEEAETFK